MKLIISLVLLLGVTVANAQSDIESAKLSAFVKALELLITRGDIQAIEKATCTDVDSISAWNGQVKDNNPLMFQPSWVMQTILRELGPARTINVSDPKRDSKQLALSKYVSFSSNVSYLGHTSERKLQSWWGLKKQANGQICLSLWLH
jgi:hypothetical protein